MPPLQHVKIGPHKGLKQAILTDLGKVNVFCGPNNSGKTTVLENLTEKNALATGIRPTKDFDNALSKKSLRGAGWEVQSQNVRTLAYHKEVTKALSSKELWFADEGTDFADAIDWRFAGSYTTPREELIRSFPIGFPATPKRVLIPAKRRIETLREVDAFQPISWSGEGVLNFLFAAKNHDEHSSSNRKFHFIQSAFQEITGACEFSVYLATEDRTRKPPASLVELRFRRLPNPWLKADDCGLGLQELLIILYFAIASEFEVILIEEPENHLHPEIQRRLLRFLRERTDKQFFISTHSSVFLDTQFADRIFTCRLTDEVKVENATSRATVLAELGYSIADNLVSDVVVLCEGPTDKPVLEEFFRKMELDKKYNIKVWPLGGDIMAQLDLTVFQQSYQILALVDGDPGSGPTRRKFIGNCEALNIPVTQLERYSLENYFSMRAIQEAMKGQTIPSITELNPKEKVSKQLGFELKGNGGKIAKAMTLEDVTGTDFGAFLRQVKTTAERR